MRLTKLILLFLALSLQVAATVAQSIDSVNVSIVVKDSLTQAPLGYAAIKLQCASGNSLEGAITSSEGIAMLTLKTGSCALIELLASRTGYISKKLLLRQNDSLPGEINQITIGLVPAVKQLKEIVISPEAIKRELDKSIYRVRAADFPEGAKIADIINRVPGLSVNGTEQVLIKGRIPADVYLNGKAISAAVLKTIPADAIKQIEIIDNPGASFSGEAAGGIINLILKNNKYLSGGSIAASSGLVRGQYMGNGSVIFNNRKLFAMVSTSAQFSVQKRAAKIDRITNPASTILRQQDIIHSNVLYYYINGELFYKPDSTSEISAVVNTNLTKFESRGNSTSNIIKNNSTSNTGLIYRYNYMNRFLGSTLEYKKDIDRYNTAVFTGGYQCIPKWMNIDNKEWSGLSSTANNVLLCDTTNGSQYSMQLVFSGKNDLSQINEWEGGVVYHRESSKDGYGQLSRQSNDEFLADAGNTGRLIFNKKTSAAYALANTAFFKKYKVSFGARLEYYQLYLRYLATSQVGYRQFYNLLPSLSVLQNLKSGHALTLDYSRKTTRPDVSILSPFNYGTSRVLANSGNTTVVPELCDKLSLSVSKFSDGKYYDLTLYSEWWSHAIFERTINSIPDSSVTRAFYNFDKYISQGVSCTFLIPFKQNITLNGTLYSEIFNLEDKPLLLQKHSGIIWGLTANLDITLKNKTNVAANLSYTSYDYEYQEITKNYPLISLLIQKPVCKDRFSLSISWMDVLGTGFNQKKKYDDGWISQVAREKGRNNNIIFGITYNFGKNLTNQSSQKTIVSDEVKERKQEN